MKIRLDQPVHTLDGLYGELADVVVEPGVDRVTHIVVQPHHKHHQARLVPMSMVDVIDGVLTVDLSTEHVRALQRVAETDYARLGDPIDLGLDWDVGIEHVMVLSYGEYGYEFGTPVGARYVEDEVPIDYDRIPQGECEIRRQSIVETVDGHQVGVVDGMVLDGTHVTGVYVHTGFLGLRHRVLVPIAEVERVRNDQITISMDKQAFHRLEPVEESLDDLPGRGANFEHRAATIWKKLAGAVRPR